MIRKDIFILVIVIVVVILTYYLFNLHTGQQEDFMYGMWKGDSNFCEDSEVSSMLLFIGEPESNGWWGTARTCCLVINNDVCNQKMTLKYNKPWLTNVHPPTSISKYKIHANAEYEEEDVMPEQLVLEFDMPKCQLRIHDNEKMYGIFYKDGEITNTAKKMKLATDLEN